MIRYQSVLFFLLLLGVQIICIGQDKNQFKILQLNVWMEGTKIENGIDATANIILQTDADFVTLSEVNKEFMVSLIDSLQSKQHTYYCIPSEDCGILSKFPIENQNYVYSPALGHNGILKASIKVNDIKLKLYAAHLDWLYYGAFLPRGYNGQNWKKMESPITEVDEILAFNQKSYRDEQINTLIKDVNDELEKGSIIVVAGDFNEPSHLDWDEVTKNLFSHNGTIIPWYCTTVLEKNGFVDAYREKFPNPKTHPGFTWPADNPSVSVDELSWAPEADERDRIDFIFFHNENPITIDSSVIVGPNRSIIRGIRAAENTEDPFFNYIGGWPSDHKGILSYFSITY